MAKSVSKEVCECRVSSVLNNDRKQFGKKYLFDGKEETCWNSDRGSPQWIEFSFPAEKEITQMVIQFQGGFAAKTCTLEAINDDKSESEANINAGAKKVEFYPKDTNTTQAFQVDNLLCSKNYKLIFVSSYDFYGRIIIYNLDILS